MQIFEETLDFSTTSSATGTFYLDGDASALVVCIYSIDDADLDLFDDVTFSLGEGQAFYVDHDQLMGVYTYHNYTSISKVGRLLLIIIEFESEKAFEWDNASSRAYGSTKSTLWRRTRPPKWEWTFG